MTSATIGLPDRYRPLDQVGPDEPTPTGVIRCWRAKDRVLNRDVAIRVHTPAGAAAHAWITRALTAGGLATPALAMVYDASEGGEPGQGGGAAYVVNEWIDGETLADRLTRGPLAERETRTVLRRLAEGVAEAHRVGLAVGGLTPEHVVLRPNGLVGLRAVPAATGSIQGDITALGELLESCLTGRPAGEVAPAPTGPSDLVALARRARSTEPGQGLTSVAAMAALLGERPRSGATPSVPLGRGDDSDGGWLRRLRERRAESDNAAAPAVPSTAAVPAPAPDGHGGDEAPVRLDPHTLPPVPTVRPLPAQTPVVPGGDTIDVSVVPPSGRHAGPDQAPAVPPTPDGVFSYGGPDTRSDSPFGVLGDDPYTGEEYVGDAYPDRPLVDTGEVPASRRRLAVIGLPLLALAVVIALAWWLGSNVLSVAGNVDEVQGSTPSASTSAAPSTGQAAAGTPITIVSGAVFDPFGDGAPENDRDVPLSFDGNPSTAWSTLTYRGSPAFGNLKPGVGVLYDLGSPQPLASVTVATTTPGATVEIRSGDNPQAALDGFAVAAHGTLQRSSELAFEKPVTARYLLVWVTGLVDHGDGFSADLAEISVRSAS
jgi:eukaryotic-like serine/threonine-protein kinase